MGGGEAGDRVHRHGAPAPAGKRPDPAGDAEGLGGVGEVQARHGGDLEPAELDPAVPAVAGLVHHGDVAPRQGGELVAQAGLVILDDQHIRGVGDGDQPVGVVALGVQRVLCRSLRYADVARGGRW